MKVLAAQSCLTLCDIMDWSPLGSSVHGILQARILEWAAIPFSRGSSWPRDQTCVSSVSCLADGFFTISTTWEAHALTNISLFPPPTILCSSSKSLTILDPTYKQDYAIFCLSVFISVCINVLQIHWCRWKWPNFYFKAELHIYNHIFKNPFIPW